MTKAMADVVPDFFLRRGGECKVDLLRVVDERAHPVDAPSHNLGSRRSTSPESGVRELSMRPPSSRPSCPTE